MKHTSGKRVTYTLRRSRWKMFGDAFVNGMGFVAGVAFIVFMIGLVLRGFH